jgi:hypothetical protein
LQQIERQADRNSGIKEADMILKIGKTGERDSDDIWFYLDKIDEVKVEKAKIFPIFKEIKKGKNMTPEEAEKNEMRYAGVSVSLANDGVFSSDTPIQFTRMFANDEELAERKVGTIRAKLITATSYARTDAEVIAMDYKHKAFLLNDQGGTIERL